MCVRANATLARGSRAPQRWPMDRAPSPHQLGACTHGSRPPQPIRGRRKPVRHGRYGCRFGRHVPSFGAYVRLIHPHHMPQARNSRVGALRANPRTSRRSNMHRNAATLTPKPMLFTFVNFARSRRSRRSRCARQDGAIRWRQHAPRHRSGRAWLGLSGRSRAARACHLPASSRLSRSGTELVRGGHCPTRSCQ